MLIRLYQAFLLFVFSCELQASMRPSCDDDPLAEGQEPIRLQYAIRCHYLPGKAWAYYASFFDPVSAQRIPSKSIKNYPIFAKKSGQSWTVWRPEDQEADFPQSCSKPKSIEWAGSCIKD